MERGEIPVRVRPLKDVDGASELQTTTPDERLGMMWQLAMDAWAFMGDPVAEPRLPRHVVRVVRGGKQSAESSETASE